MRYVGVGLLTLSFGLGPALAMAAPPEDGGDQSQSQGDGQAQGQAQDQTGSEGTGDQSQRIDPPSGNGQGSNNNNSPNIIVQPQIQVQVQPTIDVSAKPTAGADANTNANSNADADANGTISTDQKSSSQSDNAMDADIAGSNVNEGGVDGSSGVAGSQGRLPTKVTRRYVTTRTVYRPVHHRYGERRAVQPQRDDPRGVGAMIIGFGTFGGVYAHTAFNAAYLWDRCAVVSPDVSECQKMPADMFIPVAGPFMAMQHTDSAQNKVRLAALGGAQSAGIVLGLIGAIIYSRDTYKNRVLNEYGVRVSKKQDLRISPNGAGVSLNLRF